MSAKRSKTTSPDGLSAEARAIAAGGCALLAGFFVYLLARDLTALVAVPRWLAALVDTPITLPGAGQLPSLLHSYAFAMLAIAALRPWRHRIVAVCAAWALIAVALELAQSSAAAALPALAGYSAATTFDPMDLAAALVGAALAAWHGTRIWGTGSPGDNRDAL